MQGKLFDPRSSNNCQLYPSSYGTVEQMCDEQASLFNYNTTADMIMDYGCNADVYAQQERLVLGYFCDYLIKLICRGKAKGKESTSFRQVYYCRDKLSHEI